MIKNNNIFYLTTEGIGAPVKPPSETRVANAPAKVAARAEERDTGPKFTGPLVKINAGLEKRAMLSDNEIDAIVIDCQMVEDGPLIATGIKCDVVCRTYLNLVTLKKLLLREALEDQGYKHIIMQCYMEAYEGFRDQVIYEFRTLTHIFEELLRQQPTVASFVTPPQKGFRLREVWRSTMEKHYENIKSEEGLDEANGSDLSVGTMNLKNPMEEKKYKDKLFSNSGNFTKEMISYRIKDTLMNLKDKHGAVSFRPRLDTIDDQIMNKSADNSQDMGDTEWLEHQRKLFFKKDTEVTTGQKKKKFDDPYLTEFKGILTNSNLVSDIQTCMVNSFASTKVVTKRIADMRNAAPLKINSFIKSFMVKAQHEEDKEKDPTAGSRTSVLNKLCKPTSKQFPTNPLRKHEDPCR
jgi:hypothetical protein